MKQISNLVGEEFSAVCFVRDYVEFHFDGQIIRSLTNPQISIRDAKYAFPESGSYEALCCIIGSKLEEIHLVESEALEIVTSSGQRLTIPLIDKNKSTPEFMHFVPGENQPIQVW